MENSQASVEQLIEIFDKALTSDDERVVNALRSLMMITLLTDPDKEKRKIGPLQEVLDDVSRIHQRMRGLEEEIVRLKNRDDFRSRGWRYDENPWDPKVAGYGRDSIYGAVPGIDPHNASNLLKAINSPKIDKKPKF